MRCATLATRRCPPRRNLSVSVVCPPHPQLASQIHRPWAYIPDLLLERFMGHPRPSRQYEVRVAPSVAGKRSSKYVVHLNCPGAREGSGWVQGPGRRCGGEALYLSISFPGILGPARPPQSTISGLFGFPHSDSGSRFQAGPCIFLEPMLAHPVKTGLNDDSVLCSRCKQRHWERAITRRYRCWRCPHCA